MITDTPATPHEPSFSLHRLQQVARELAAAHRVRPGRKRGQPILSRVLANRRALERSARMLAADALRGDASSPTAEWLLDNFQLVEDQLREIEADLPPGYYAELPKLAEGVGAGLPRVFALAEAYVENTSRRFDLDALRSFVDAYQDVQPLTLGELWAVPISIRVILVEGLRRDVDVLMARRAQRASAEAIADALLAPKRSVWVGLRLRWLARTQPAPAFSARLFQRLHDRDPETTPGLIWLHAQFAERGVLPGEVVASDHDAQLRTHGPVRDAITSLRRVASVTWSDFVEEVSQVASTLADDAPEHALDFATRDRYRHAVEDLARNSTWTELAVAKEAVARARAAQRDGLREGDPGYYLLSTGRRALEADIGYRPRWRARLLRALPGTPTARYLVGILGGTALLLGALGALALSLGAGVLEVTAFAVLAALPATELATSFVQRLSARLQGPRRLPKLELEGGVPASLRALIAVPTMLTGADEVDELLDRVEVHYLSNPDAELRFALVSDCRDAGRQHLVSDEALIERARVGIEGLNARHAPPGAPVFFLLHRERRWNGREGCWMGWERKRGKLHELNQLLRGATDTSFFDLDGARALLAALDVRYVITLDSDTRLPRGAARRLVGAIAHPLNRAVFDPKTGAVARGYGILQPRVTATLPDRGAGTLTQRFYAGPAGADPYVSANSDAYQDLFGEGSYVGKGIYDVDAFERALAGRIPDNTLLSHDLLEGLYARAGLASDIELFECPPARHAVMAARTHRWVRGDWQLLRWIVGRGPIGAIGRWKMIDNLRRSLVAPASLALLVLAWLVPVERSLLWTGFVLLTIGVPAFLPVLPALIPRLWGRTRRPYARALGDGLASACGRAGLAVALMVGDARRMGDAILRTLSRLVTGRGPMLEWLTAAEVERVASPTARQLALALALSLAASSTVLVVLGLFAPSVLPVAAPIVLLWGMAPWIVRRISAPILRSRGPALDAARTADLRRVARRTWSWFETFVTAEHHALPPDNVQEDPSRVVAGRTSPTNIGVYLLAVVAARDLGWLGTAALIERLEATFATLDRLERQRGHLLNWYDTRTLTPLLPRYVSTVDSGNLAGHLIVLQQACLELAANTDAAPQALAGVVDAMDLVRQAIGRTTDRAAGSVQRRHLVDAADDLTRLLGGKPSPGTAAWSALAEPAELLVDVAGALSQARRDPMYDEAARWARALRDTLASHARDVALQDGRARLLALARRAEALSAGMAWGFLFEADQRLFATGWDVETGRLDPYLYDLLASECRLASFVAIARGQVKVSHWFRLGRRVAPVRGRSVLLSWSGSMFEYLMPSLVMSAPEGSLLATTEGVVVDRQIRHGVGKGVPWGISESAHNGRDLNLTYQYQNFGLQELGLKRGLAQDLVVAPYATMLAAMVRPSAAADNLVALAAVGALGEFGFYDAVDYTTARLPEGTRHAVVRSWFAHHQGMSLVALCNVLAGASMRRRFHDAPLVRATELLLHERAPREVATPRSSIVEQGVNLHVRDPVAPVLRVFDSPHDAVPATQRLSNGRYAVTLTVAGGGQSLWNEVAVTRWREDETLDDLGSFIFVRDVESGAVWSAGHQPAGVDAKDFQASFFEHRVELRRRDGSITTRLDVVVATEDDAELRQVTIRNRGARRRTLDLTSYAELVLAPDAADVVHRAFSNLFVETSFEPRVEALLATRRPRSDEEPRIWAAHLCAVHGASTQGVQFETDRARFLGRGRKIRTASAVHDGHALSNTVGAVLDPIFSLRRRVVLEPGQSVKLLFATLIGHDRGRLLALCDAYREPGVFKRAVATAWTDAQVALRHLGIEAEEAQLFQLLGSHVLYADPSMRASRDVLSRNLQGQAGLWRFGISGDRPILLGRVRDGDEPQFVRQLVHAHCYWRTKGMRIDLVLLDEQNHAYEQDPHLELERVVRSSHLVGMQNGVHLLRSEHVSPEDRDLLLTAARVVVNSTDGTLADQVTRRYRVTPPPPLRAVRPGAHPQRPLLPHRPGRSHLRPGEGKAPRLPLDHFNGLGGFSRDGRDYVIALGAGQWTPLPWVNVIANPSFGTLVSEAGSGFTWAQNSRENQITPWSNDPVSDPPGEVIYLRDDETGEVWGPTPLPMRESSPYVVRHGQGFTRFLHDSHGIALDLTQFVDAEDAVKFSWIQIHNTSGRERRLSLTAYVEWVLGSVRASAAPFVVTSIDPETGAMFARNTWSAEFAGRVAFLDVGDRTSLACGDRTAWIGRNGTLSEPAGRSLEGTAAGRVGPGLEPCGALTTSIILAPDERASVVILLGQADNAQAARALVRRARAVDPADALAAATSAWDAMLEVVQVQTPDHAMDLLLNRWLIYQTLSCRLWARAGFYQAGGAYGFRDQLQDGMALVVSRPDLVREHLLRAAAHQFPEGDVQHWWHPPSGKGVRTRFSDDRVWLAYTLDHYLEVTADRAILNEQVPFLDAATLTAEQEDSYQHPGVTPQTATLYEHAARALDVSLQLGRHGLPLIGTGDWNDGMNRVGAGGAGESVWLAWFLITTLERWIPIAASRGDTARADTWRAHVAGLRGAVEAEAWDGDWYRRAFADDGTPLGSASNLEGRIDSIAQSWAVLSGAGQPERAAHAMAAVEEHLVKSSDGLILLLTPPFDQTPHDPGYIKGYLPGVRENGGQYTHAAIWVVMAFAALGDGDRAAELFAMLNPIRHTDTRAAVQRYKAEPYVVAADVYGAGAQIGRGGWTWYTGSASWMYRAGMESILGLRVRGDRLNLAPCIPSAWPGFRATVRRGAATWKIVVTNPDGVQRGLASLRLDGEALDAAAGDVPFRDDGRAHEVEVVMG